jgi:hypothetical protein
VLCVGSSHALSDIQPPGHTAMWPGTTAGELLDLAQIADLAVEAGFRPAWIETASDQEWEEFESGYQADEEEWLAAHPGHPQVPVA